MLARPLFLLLAGVFMLAACSNPYPHPTRGEVFANGWLTEEVSDEPLPPVYCYSTIGVVDCYGEPVESEIDRLVAHTGPTPPAAL